MEEVHQTSPQAICTHHQILPSLSWVIRTYIDSKMMEICLRQALLCLIACFSKECFKDRKMRNLSALRMVQLAILVLVRVELGHKLMMTKVSNSTWLWESYLHLKISCTYLSSIQKGDINESSVKSQSSESCERDDFREKQNGLEKYIFKSILNQNL